MAKSLALGYAADPAGTSGSVFDPQTALALMAPGLVGPDGKVDVQGYQQQRMWQGLMGLAAGLLSKSGPSTTPVGFGQALGAGLGGMLDAQQGYDRGTLGAASAARAFADIGKLGAEQRLMQGQADAAKRMAALAPQLFSDGGSAATPAAIAGVPGNIDQVIGGPGGDSALMPGGAVAGAGIDALAGQYAPLIKDAAAKYGIPPDIFARQIGQESGYDPNARSPKGALGIAQFMPGTAQRFMIDPLKPEQAIPAAAQYLSKNRDLFGGNLGLALAGYNWGEGNVQKWLKNGGNAAAMPAETRSYVANITGRPIEAWLGGGAPDTLVSSPGQSSEPTVSIAGQNGRLYNLTQAQADQFYRLGDGDPKQRFLANLSMTRKTPDAVPAASNSAPIAPQSLPGQIQVNGVKIPRPDIAQQMMLYSAISGVKMPSFVEEAAKMPIDQYMKLYQTQLDIAKAGPIAGSQAAATQPYTLQQKQFESDLAARNNAFQQGAILNPQNPSAGVTPLPGYSQINAANKGAEAGAVAAAQLPSQIAQKRAEADINVNPNAFSGNQQAPAYGPGTTEPLKTDRGTIIPPVTQASPIVGSADYLKDLQTGKGGWADTERGWNQAVQTNANDEQTIKTVAKALQSFATGSFAGPLADLRAKARAFGLEIPDNIAGDPAKAQLVTKEAFQRMIGSMRGIDSNPTGWQIQNMVSNWVSTDSQPETNYEIITNTIGALRQTNALARDWADAKRLGWRNPQDFANQWMAIPDNSREAFVDRAKQEIPAFKGMGKPLDDATAANARAAIAKGAQRDAVIQRLRQSGYDANGL